MSSKNKDKAASGPGKPKVKRTKVMKEAPAAVKKTRAHHGVPTAAAAPAGMNAGRKPYLPAWKAPGFVKPIIETDRFEGDDQSFYAAIAGKLREVGAEYFRLADSDIVVTLRRRGDNVEPVTLNERMLATDLQKYVVLTMWKIKGKAEPRRVARNISNTEAGRFLSSGVFLDSLPSLHGVRDMAFPAWCEDVPAPGANLDGFRALFEKDGEDTWKLRQERELIRLLPEGFDEATGIFTESKIFYGREPTTVEQCLNVFVKRYGTFPWEIGEGEPEPEASGKYLLKNRAFSVHISLHIAAWLERCLVGLEKPGYLYDANYQSAGKSFLAMAALSAFCPSVRSQSLPDKESDVRNTILANLGKPYLFFDNVKHYLDCPALDNLITAHRGKTQGRQLQTNENIAGTAPMVILTGNSLTLSKDHERRFIAVRLHVADAKTRPAPELEELFRTDDPGVREEVADATSGLVYDWARNGAPLHTKGMINSFEWFTAIINGILVNAGLPPIEKGKDLCGSKEEIMRVVVEELASGLSEGAHDVTGDQLIDKVEEMGYLPDIVKSETALGKKQQIGWAMTPFKKGLLITDKLKRKVHVAKKKEKGGIWVFKVME